MLEAILQPWPWYVSGPMLALVMFLMLYFGKQFGVSSTLRVACSAVGAGKKVDFFRFDWKSQIWNIIFVIGAIIGGWITSTFLSADSGVNISKETAKVLQNYGFANPGSNILPTEIFSFENLFHARSLIMIIGGGLLVGFGARYAGGCTSGHAISGLSNLQLPSLVAVIGFFIGGLIMTHLILPFILSL